MIVAGHFLASGDALGDFDVDVRRGGRDEVGALGKQASPRRYTRSPQQFRRDHQRTAHAIGEQFQRAAAGVDVVIVGNLIETLERPEEGFVPFAADNLDIAGATL